MTYKIEYSQAAARQLAGLPRNIGLRVRAAVDRLALNPRPAVCRPMVGRHGHYRVRVADKYRIVYAVRDSELIVLVVEVGRRDQIYRRR